MDTLNKAGEITVGVKSDQPGLGFRNPATGRYEGFDIKMAEIVAAELGLQPDQIEYVEVVSEDRERFLQKGWVDIVIASYSITSDRRRDVGQAGPYYITGQQILVREEDKDDITDPGQIADGKVCSVSGSTSIKRWRERYGTQPVSVRTYTECVQRLLNKSVDAVTTDGAVLLGYAALQPHKLEVVGEPFGTERYGIGYRKGDHTFCQFLNDTIKKAEDNGDWAKAFGDTLGKAGVKPPNKPPLDPCEA
jgi:glutamate transport system substrate-binding protein